MDPLDSEILHEHVHHYIAQHLTGKDLLAMSEVSMSWNEFAEGQKIGDKVRLKVDLKRISAEDSLDNSQINDLRNELKYWKDL